MSTALISYCRDEPCSSFVTYALQAYQLNDFLWQSLRLSMGKVEHIKVQCWRFSIHSNKRDTSIMPPCTFITLSMVFWREDRIMVLLCNFKCVKVICNTTYRQIKLIDLFFIRTVFEKCAYWDIISIAWILCMFPINSNGKSVHMRDHLSNYPPPGCKGEWLLFLAFNR